MIENYHRGENLRQSNRLRRRKASVRKVFSQLENLTDIFFCIFALEGLIFQPTTVELVLSDLTKQTTPTPAGWDV